MTGGVSQTAPDPAAGVVVTANVISGNAADGVRAVGGGSHFLQANTVSSNKAHGVLLTGGSSFNTLAPGNAVATNELAGLAVVGGGGNVSTQTTYSLNGGLGIDRGDDGVTLEAVPVLVSSWLPIPYDTVYAVGYLDAEPNATYVIEIFGNANVDPSGYGEGEGYIASVVVVTDSFGHADFSPSLPAGLLFLSATSTRTDAADPADNWTSEFSNTIATLVEVDPGGGETLHTYPGGSSAEGFGPPGFGAPGSGPGGTGSAPSPAGRPASAPDRGPDEADRSRARVPFVESADAPILAAGEPEPDPFSPLFVGSCSVRLTNSGISDC